MSVIGDAASSSADPLSWERQTLAFVNHLREKWGLGDPVAELPPGIPHEVQECPVARGVRAGNTRHVRATTVGVLLLSADCHPELCESVPLPVAEFMRAFDAGRYPKLVAS